MSPGMAVEKYVLSISDLETHDPDVHAYPSQDVIKAYSSGGDGFNGTITNPKSGKTEKILKLICFGCKEVCKRTRARASTIFEPGLEFST